MISYHKGDLLEAGLPVIVHGCNCRGAMNSGIAKQIRKRYREVYERYNELCSHMSPDDLLGMIQAVRMVDVIVINAFTQRNYGYNQDERYVSYDAIDNAMERIALLFEPGIDIIGMPKIGAGLGGGDWGIIEAIIKKNLGHFDVRIYTL